MSSVEGRTKKNIPGAIIVVRLRFLRGLPKDMVNLILVATFTKYVLYLYSIEQLTSLNKKCNFV